MSESLITDWLNENSFRSYPLRCSGSLPENVIVDAQLCYSTPTVATLNQIIVDDTHISCHVAGGLVFQASKTQPFPQAVRADGSLLVFGEGAPSLTNGTYTYSLEFEPSVVYEFADAWLGVSSLSFAGHVGSLSGMVEFREGYQFGISITNPVISLTAGNLQGTPVGCGNFSAFPTDCDDVLSYINGADASVGLLRIIAGGGVVVLDDPANHRIYIGLSFTTPSDVCQPIPPNPKS